MLPICVVEALLTGVLAAKPLLVGRLVAVFLGADFRCAHHLDTLFSSVVDAEALFRDVLIAIGNLATFVLQNDAPILAAPTAVSTHVRVLLTILSLALLVVDFNSMSPGMGDAIAFLYHILAAALFATALVRYIHTILLGVKLAVVLFMDRMGASLDLANSRATNLIQTSCTSMHHAIILASDMLPAIRLDASLALIIDIHPRVASMHSAPTFGIRKLVTTNRLAHLHLPIHHMAQFTRMIRAIALLHDRLMAPVILASTTLALTLLMRNIPICY
jgi:hypothetical protein